MSDLDGPNYGLNSVIAQLNGTYTLPPGSGQDFRISSYLACGIADSTTQVNNAIAAAAAVVSGTAGARVIFDCPVTVSGAINIPSNAANMIFDGTNKVISVAASYNGNLFTLPTTPTAAQNNVNISFVNLSFAYNGALRTAGAIFAIGNCDACSWDHINYTGKPFDLFDLGSPGSVNYVVRSSFNDVWGRSGGNYHGFGFRFLGQAGSLTFSNLGFGCDNTAGSGAVLWDDTALGVNPNWDAFYFSDADFELCGRGFRANMQFGLLNDVFLQPNTIVDSTVSGPDFEAIASGSGTVRRVRIHPWFSSGSANAAVSLSQSGGGSVYDVQIEGGHIVGGPGAGIAIGAGVKGTKVNGTQFYLASGNAVSDAGTDTTVEGAIIGTSTGYGANNAGIAAAATAIGGHYHGNDLRGNTTFAVTAAAGAGTSDPLVVDGNDVAGYSSNNPFSFNAASFVAEFSNYGYLPTLNGVSCSSFEASTQAGPTFCADGSGNGALPGIFKGGNGFFSVGVTAPSVYDTTLSSGLCVQTFTGGQLTTTANPCAIERTYTATYTFSADCLASTVCAGALSGGPSGVINGACYAQGTSSGGSPNSSGYLMTVNINTSGAPAAYSLIVFNARASTTTNGTAMPLTIMCVN